MVNSKKRYFVSYMGVTEASLSKRKAPHGTSSSFGGSGPSMPLSFASKGATVLDSSMSKVPWSLHQGCHCLTVNTVSNPNLSHGELHRKQQLY